MLEEMFSALQREKKTAFSPYPLLNDLPILPDVADVQITTTPEALQMTVHRTDNAAVAALLRPPTQSDFQGHTATIEEAQQEGFLILDDLKIVTSEAQVDVKEYFYQDALDAVPATIAVRAENAHIRALPKDVKGPKKDPDKAALLRSLLLHKPSINADSRARFAANTAIMATLPVTDLDFAVLYHELAELALHETDPQADTYYAVHAQALADMQNALREEGHSSRGLSAGDQLRFLSELSQTSRNIAVRTTTHAFLDAYFRHELHKKRRRLKTEQQANVMMIQKTQALMHEIGQESSMELVRKRKDFMNFTYQVEMEEFIRGNVVLLQQIGLLGEAKSVRTEYAIADPQTIADCNAILFQWRVQRSQPLGRPVYQSTSV